MLGFFSARGGGVRSVSRSVRRLATVQARNTAGTGGILFNEADFEAVGSDVARVARTLGPSRAAAMAHRTLQRRSDSSAREGSGTLDGKPIDPLVHTSIHTRAGPPSGDAPPQTLTSLGHFEPPPSKPGALSALFTSGAQLRSSVRYPGHVGSIDTAMAPGDAARALATGYAGEIARIALQRGWSPKATPTGEVDVAGAASYLGVPGSLRELMEKYGSQGASGQPSEGNDSAVDTSLPTAEEILARCEGDVVVGGTQASNSAPAPASSDSASETVNAGEKGAKHETIASTIDRMDKDITARLGKAESERLRELARDVLSKLVTIDECLPFLPPNSDVNPFVSAYLGTLGGISTSGSELTPDEVRAVEDGIASGLSLGGAQRVEDWVRRVRPVNVPRQVLAATLVAEATDAEGVFRGGVEKLNDIRSRCESLGLQGGNPVTDAGVLEELVVACSISPPEDMESIVPIAIKFGLDEMRDRAGVAPNERIFAGVSKCLSLLPKANQPNETVGALIRRVEVLIESVGVKCEPSVHENLQKAKENAGGF